MALKKMKILITHIVMLLETMIACVDMKEKCIKENITRNSL
jgi:hypothetical protein